MKKEELRERAKNRSRTMRTAKGTYYNAIPMSELNLLINRLDEPEITPKQAWEVIAPRFSMEPKQLEESVVHGFVAKVSEEIEMESDQIRKFADMIKKLHAENEELKAKIDEPEVVVIPKFLADYLENAKKEISLLRVFEIANGLNELDMWRKEYNWIRLYHLDFARAWLDGYKLIEERVYYALFKGHELTLDSYKNLALYKGTRSPMYISYKHPLNDEFVIKMSKNQWNELGINDSNANFVKVEELEE